MTGPHAERADRAEPAAEPPAERAAEPPYRILLVEDDPGDALLVEELLADTGLDVALRWKKTLGDALTEIRRQAPDVVLLDLHLPDVSGVPAVGAVQEACPAAAVVVLTGLAESRAGSQAVASGAQDYLVKGQVEPDLLNRVLRYAIQRKQAEHANAELLENRIHAQENVRLERGLLPAPLLRGPEVVVTSRYLPGRQRALLGGDFLDVVQTSDGMVHAVIGDVSGHGPDEAALGVLLRITWRALTLAGHRGVELMGLLEEVLVAERPRPDMFTTCATVALDPATDLATVTLAGHHPPLLCLGRTAREMDAALGIALGILPGHGAWRPTESRLSGAAGLLLYTDGLIEGHTGQGRQRLGTAGLIDLVAGASAADAEGLLDHLVTTAQSLNAGRHADDLAVLHLAWTAPGALPGQRGA